MSEAELYAGREQTLVKHYILEHYLERFAHIVGSAWDAITYVDCFAGPWNVQTTDLQDSSFCIALRELRKARKHLGDGLGRNLALRCYFLERDSEAYQKLDQFARSVTDTEIATRNATLEESVQDILTFVRKEKDAFPFIFIDPTGWTGFAMDTISPLLRLHPCEVLVNFMTGHIARFAEHPEPGVRESFDRLFGSPRYRQRITALSGSDREEELVRSYADALRQAGGFNYVCTAMILQSEKDRTHFHLLYATRNPRGVAEFKKVEKKAMQRMEQARAEAQQRLRLRSGQGELFGAQEMHHPSYYGSLRDRHVNAARQEIQQILIERLEAAYDEIWVKAMTYPLAWESDLRTWIDDWVRAGSARRVGFTPRQRVCKYGAGHRIAWNTADR